MRQGYFPLRSNVGDLLPIEAVELVDHAPDIDPAGITLQIIDSITSPAFEHHPKYSEFLPSKLTLPGGAFAPGDGLATFPAPTGAAPGPAGGVPFLFIAVSGPEATGRNFSRTLWIELRLKVAWRKGSDPVLGGILFGGYPYLPSYVTEAGETSANFGLPREIRVAWTGQHAEGFLDANSQITRQEMCSHSDAQALPIGRVEGTELRIRLADFPKVLLANDPVKERWGILVPYLFVYAHTEGARYAPEVPAGVLAVTQDPPPLHQSVLFPSLNDGTDAEKEQYRGTSANYVASLNERTGERFYMHTAASSVGGAVVSRSYPDHDEHFTSCYLDKGHLLRVVLAQSEEHARCLAGLRLRHAKPPAFRTSVNAPKQRAQATLRIYEVDPPAGASPVALDRDLARDKYCRLLGQWSASALEAAVSSDLPMRFTRTTASRVLALEFEAETEGHVNLSGLSLIQSAHVSVTPRPAMARRVRAMHFRMVGRDIAGDLARVGPRAFSLRVERQLAGQPAATILECDTLLDLIQSGARVRQYSSSLAEDVSDTLPGSFSVAEAQRRDKGWTRQETGNGLAGDFRGRVGPDGPEPDPDGRHGFRQVSAQETRSHHESIGDVQQWFLDALLSTSTATQLNPDNAKLARQGNGIWTPWNPLNETLNAAERNAIIADFTVSGQWNVNLPPLAQSLWNNAGAIASQAGTTISAATAADVTNASSITTLLTEIGNMGSVLGTAAIGNSMSAALLVSGVSVGVSPGFSGTQSAGPPSLTGSIGASVSANIAVPAVSHSTTLGDSGMIVRQGAMVDYAYNQSLSDSYQEGRSRTDYLRGRSARTARRRVYWQGEALDVITGTLPLGISLPATADYSYRTTDQSLRVTLGTGPGQSRDPALDFTTLDIWFDIDEEPVRDDY